MGLFSNNFEYFLKCYGEKSLSSVSKKIGQTQASVSIAIAKLESELGVKLFERQQRGIVLTSEGQRLMTLLVARNAEIQRDMKTALGVLQPSLLVGVSNSALTPNFLNAFHRFHGEKYLVVAEADALYSALFAEDLDVIYVRVSSTKEIPPKDFHYRVVKYHNYFFLGRTDRFKHLKKMPPKDFMKVAPLAAFRPYKQVGKRSVFASSEYQFEVQSVEALRTIVLGGYAIALIDREIFTETELRTLTPFNGITPDESMASYEIQKHGVNSEKQLLINELTRLVRK